METKCIVELWMEIQEQKGSCSPKDFNKKLYDFGEKAITGENYYYALKAYFELKDRIKVREVAKKCLDEGWNFDAFRAFKFLEYKEGMLKAVKALDGKVDEMILTDYLGEKNTKKLFEGFREWASGYGFQKPLILKPHEVANAAYNFASNYDLGVGIAKSGLFPAYVFNLFGLEIKIVDAHRRGRGATLKWKSEISPEDFKGKELAVFDKDVVSGRTSKRVLKELLKYEPKSVDIILIHNPGYTNVSSIPKGYDNIFCLGNIGYLSLDKAFKNLEERLKLV